MKKSTTPTFILELPLVVSKKDERLLIHRFRIGSRLYNVVLQESLSRLNAIRSTKLWEDLKSLREKIKSLKNEEEKKKQYKGINEQYEALKKEYLFNENELAKFAIVCKNSANWKEYLGSFVVEQIAIRAFKSTEMWMYGKREKPRFKAESSFESLVGRKNKSITWNSSENTVRIGTMILHAKTAPIGKDLWQEEALKAKTKYCTIVRREIKGIMRYSVQLAQEGISPFKPQNKIAIGESSALDLGPTNIAFGNESETNLVKLCPSVVHPWKKIKRIQRAIDRSRRSNNPHCFNPNGTYIKGQKISVKSNRYKKLCIENRETERKLSAARKQDHGTLCNKIISLGNTVKFEKLSMVGWQKTFGRSIKTNAAGGFISALKQKAKQTGGKIIELNPRSLKMSQYDHTNGTYTKKPLKQRWHTFSDGSGMIQRDVYSSILALATDGEKHDPVKIQEILDSQKNDLVAKGLWKV